MKVFNYNVLSLRKFFLNYNLLESTLQTTARDTSSKVATPKRKKVTKSGGLSQRLSDVIDETVLSPLPEQSALEVSSTDQNLLSEKVSHFHSS